MPEINANCDVKQGYHFQKGANATVGYITAMVLESQALAADQTTIKDPLNPDATLWPGVVVVLSGASWGMGSTSPMYFTGQISAANMQTLRAFMTKVTDIKVHFKFAVYEYDSVMRTMFKSFHSGDATLEGHVEKKGNDLALQYSTSPLAFPPQPKTFPLSCRRIGNSRCRSRPRTR